MRISSKKLFMTFVLLLVFGLVLAGCKKRPEPDPQPSGEKQKVTFVIGHGLEDQVVEVEKGKPVTLIAAPQVADLEFAGWYTNKLFTTLYDETAPVTRDISIYARYAKFFTLKFDSQGENWSIPSQKIKEGEHFTVPEDPVRYGYIFVGWCSNPELTEGFDFNEEVTGNVTLYANWRAKREVTVKFNVNGGTPVAEYKIIANEEGTFAPVAPEKEGYVFAGWFNDEKLTQAHVFGTTYNDDVTLYAKWAPAAQTKYTVKYFLPTNSEEPYTYGDEPDEVDVFYGETDSEVTLEPKMIGNLMADPANMPYKVTIAPDGSAEISLYYVKKVVYYVLNLNGGYISYESREAMTEDFLKDFNEFLKITDPKDMVTVEKLVSWGNWAPLNMHKFIYEAKYRAKWLWVAIYCAKTAVSDNGKACRDAVAKETIEEFKKVNSSWPHGVEYEFRAFFAGFHRTANAGWPSADYTKEPARNGFWQEMEEYKGTLTKDNITEFPCILPVAYREGYTFGGWYKNAEFTGDPVTEVVDGGTFHAKWDLANPLTEIKISNPVTELAKGATHQLSLEFIPADAYSKEVFFKSSDETILTVSEEGLVTAVNVGKATITISAVLYPGVETTLEITIPALPDVLVTMPDGFNGTLKAGETVQPVVTGVGAFADQKVTYTAVNPAVATVAADGTITAVASGNAEIEVKVEGADASVLYSFKLNVTVIDPLTADLVDEVVGRLIDLHQPVAIPFNARLQLHQGMGVYKATYFSVNKYLFDGLNKDTTYAFTDAEADEGKNNSGLQTSTEFIAVHDTGNPEGTANGHGSFFRNQNKVSIHYVVGDGKVVVSLPEKYIAWHAGDGIGTPFEWIDTGVKAENTDKPVISINAAGKFTFNGTETTVAAPTGKGGEILDDSYLTYLGPAWKIGTDGNYKIGTTYFQTSQVARGVIASHGGNNNAIGIETCVNTDGDVVDTWQRTAKLCADIAHRHGLDRWRVRQHNTFDGKNCPQSMFATGGWAWDYFMDAFDFELDLLGKYAGVTISMVSGNADLLANTGRIIGMPEQTTTVSYDLTVTKDGVSKTITLSTVIQGTNSWIQKVGKFPAE